MSKKTKPKKIKHKKFKRIKPFISKKSVKDDIITNGVDNNKDKKKLKKISKKKIRKKEKNREKEKEKIFNLNYQYLQDINEMFMNQEGIEQLEHDDFLTYHIPITPEENKDYIPLLISESDIILELLDARDIYHSRNKQIEKLINTKENKVLIYIITKCDLVSEVYITKIKNYLQKEIKDNNNNNQIIIISSQIRETIQNLILELKNIAENMYKKIKTKIMINIGIIGAPNVGKNSLIQSLELLMNTVCTGKYIFLFQNQNFCINTVPGVLYDDVEENNFLISKKHKNIKDIKEPKKLVNNLMEVIDINKLEEIYEFNRKPENLEDFIDLIKVKYEFKDENMCLYKILEDIVNGKIKYEIELNI